MRLADKLRQSVGRGILPDQSAALCVPILVSLLHPKSVVDYGCGNGAWLARFKAQGCMTVGVDRGCKLEHDIDNFIQADLTSASEPVGPSCDVALCLEVAEHLPASCASRLVAILATYRVVVFGGGIPLQGGWGHVNERWQRWWADLFAKHGYLPHDDFRRLVWGEPNVAPWYKQDVLIYTTEPVEQELGLHRAELLDVVHPESWVGIGPMGWWARLESRL